MAKSEHQHALLQTAESDLQLLDAGTMPSSIDKYLPLRYPKPATLLDYLQQPLLYFHDFTAVREAVKAFEYRFTESLKGLFESGILCAGLDRFYAPPSFLWAQEIGRAHV